MKALVSFYLLMFTVLAGCSSKNSQVEEIAQSNTRPNIIFIMADDLGYGNLGAYGQKVIKTPHIDQLANEGMKFTQCYSGAAVCAPARSVLMTGLHAGHTRVRGNFGEGGVRGLAGLEGRVPLQDEDFTVAEMLQSAGYKTALVGKWGLGEPNTSGEPNKQGFDEFYGFLNQRRAHKYYPEYLWKNKEKIILAGNQEGGQEQYTHDLFTSYALDYIDRSDETPFFLYLPYCIPHNDYEVPDLGSYENEDWREEAKAYAAMITRMDRSVGQIMQKLKAKGIDDNTIVFFTSDNGAAGFAVDFNLFDDNAPLRGIKRDPYEGGIRVPMIVRYPGKIAENQTNHLPWYFADVLPTLADLTKTEINRELDGESVLPTLLGEKQQIERALYWEFYELKGWRAVRFGDWKAIQQNMHAVDHDPIELYDLSSDIGETKNVSKQRPEILKQAVQLFETAHIPSPHYKWQYLKKNSAP